MDRVYRLSCYRAALEALPVDVRTYSSAEDDIRRALLYAQIRKPDPGRRPASSSSTSSRSTFREAAATPSRSGPPARAAARSGDRTRAAAPRIDHVALPVPLPLIALAAVSTFLLGLGSVGFLRRRIASHYDGG